MGDPTFRTEYTLDRKLDQDRVKLNITFIMSITDETAFLPTGALGLEELQSIYHTVIHFLRKMIAFFKDNCYHDVGNSTKEHGSWCCREKDRATWMVGPVFFIGISFFYRIFIFCAMR